MALEKMNYRSAETIEEKANRLMKATPEERMAEGYYTPDEIRKYNILKEQVKGMLNDEKFIIEGVWLNLEFVRGWIYVTNSSSATLPQCLSVGGGVVVNENASLDLPQCKSVRERVVVEKKYIS